MIFTSARSASDSLASSDSSSPFASGAASFEFPGSDNDEKLLQDDDESDRKPKTNSQFQKTMNAANNGEMMVVIAYLSPAAQ